MKVLAGVFVMTVVFGPLVVTCIIGNPVGIGVATWWFTVAGAYWLGWDDGATSERGRQAFRAIDRHLGIREEG